MGLFFVLKLTEKISMVDDLLLRRSRVASVYKQDLARLGIPMSTIPTIIAAADKASAELQKELGDGGASVALAIALGRLCAATGLDLEHVVAMVDIANRETRAELDRGSNRAA